MIPSYGKNVINAAWLGLIITLWACGADSVRFEPYEYTCEGQAIRAELGRFLVPQRHSNPRGPTLTLAFLKLKSTATKPGSPIVYLAGGPGGSGISLAKGPRGKAFLAMREAGDVIALDQRGVGLSEPNLTCPGTLDFPLTSPGDYAPMLARLDDKSRVCASYWRDRGIDLSAFNVVESAHDLDSLREALGAKKMRLWGSSYGTFLAFSVIRHHGKNVERAVLSGVEGPDHTLKLPSTTDQQFRAIAKLVSEDPVLRNEIPDFTGLLAHVLKTAEEKPFEIPIQSEPPQRITLGRFDLEQLILAFTGARDDIEQLPLTVLAFARRDLMSPRVQAVARLVTSIRTGSIGSAMTFAMDCASSTSEGRTAQIQQEARAGMIPHFDFPIPEVCSAWDVARLPASEHTPVRSYVPVLFLSGTLDGRTPPANVMEVMKGFPKSHHVLIEGSGHGNDLFISSPELPMLMVEYMKSGKMRTSKIQLPPVHFR